MTPAPRTDVLTGAIHNYWWISSLGGLYFAGGFLAWGGTRAAVVSSSLFLVSALAGLVVDYRVHWAHRRTKMALIIGHLLLGHAILVWQKAYLPLTDYTATGNVSDRDFLIYLVSALIVGTLSMFGGAWGAALGLAVHYTVIFDIREPFTFKWAFPVLVALTGNIVSTALWRLDEAYSELERLANHDALTGLLNRHQLVKAFDGLQAHARTTGQALVLVEWDLDDLKMRNDPQGHLAGDAYIRDFARALQAHVRKPSDRRAGDAAFRVGGDEFISLHLDAADGEAVIQRVRHACPSASAGWVRCDNSLTLDQALTHADAALYRNKERRKRSAETRIVVGGAARA